MVGHKVYHRFHGCPPTDELRGLLSPLAVGCFMLVGAVWLALLAGLVIAATRWLWLNV